MGRRGVAPSTQHAWAMPTNSAKVNSPSNAFTLTARERVHWA
jgi:hypothetical protein